MPKINPTSPSSLKDFSVLSFDVYSTLIDEPTGMYTNLHPLLSHLPTPNPYINNKEHTLSTFHAIEHTLQSTHPTLPYNTLLSRAYIIFASSLSLPPPSKSESEDFGNSIHTWPAFPDTIPALISLKQIYGYKIVILSNTDNASISKTLSGPLKEVEFDLVLTAQEIGSYKPDVRNFEYLIGKVGSELGLKEGKGNGGLLHVAQSLRADLIPAKEVGLSGVFIDRRGEGERAKELRGKGMVDFGWEFGTLGEMVEGIERGE